MLDQTQGIGLEPTTWQLTAVFIAIKLLEGDSDKLLIIIL